VTEGVIHSVAFSPDSKTLVAGYSVGDTGGGAVRFDIDLMSWRRQAGFVANRKLSLAEWQEYFPGQLYRKTFDWLPAAAGTEPIPEVKSSHAPVSAAAKKD